MNIKEKLELRSELVTESGCRIWLGAMKNNGYGHMRFDGRTHMVHRLAWEAMHGPIPDGFHVCHRCDVRCCLNTSHLFIGTHQENVDDCVRKGRMHRGEQQGMSKLTDDQIRAIRIDRRTLQEIGDAYGVHLSNISYIRRNKTWTHVKDAES